MESDPPNNPNLSRLDAIIKRKELLDSNADRLWNELWEAVQQTAWKLREQFNIDISVSLNDGNTIIRAGVPVRLHEKDQFTRVRPTVEVRYDSSGKGDVERDCRLFNKRRPEWWGSLF